MYNVPVSGNNTSCKKIWGWIMHSLRFCENNLNDEAMKNLVEKTKAEFPNVDISVEPCVGHCEKCGTVHIATADDTLVTGDTTQVLFERIKNSIGEREVAMTNKKP
jgi:uncharacterized protein YuzB (UPF0349 family)